MSTTEVNPGPELTLRRSGDVPDVAVRSSDGPLTAVARTARGWAASAPEALSLVLLYAVYTLLRDHVSSARTIAVARGQRLERVERSLRLDPEHSLNRLVAAHPVLAYICDYDYAVAHFLVTLIVLVLLYRRNRSVARRLAAIWYVTNLLALLGFWLYALAPPRLLPGAGFVDTVVVFHTWGSWGTGAVASAANQYAAMPSLHIAWSTWCAVGVWSLTRRRSVRMLAAAYPVWTLFVVLGTANHYLVDALGGVVDLSVAAGLVWVAGRAVAAWQERLEPGVVLAPVVRQ